MNIESKDVEIIMMLFFMQLIIMQGKIDYFATMSIHGCCTHTISLGRKQGQNLDSTLLHTPKLLFGGGLFLKFWYLGIEKTRFLCN